MLNLVGLLASLGDQGPLYPGQGAAPPFRPGVRESLVVVGAMLLITILVMIWAIYFRKPKRRHQSQHHGSARPTASPQPAPTPLGHDETVRRKWRRRRRDHRPRNPTLAETGGLPPVRTDDSTTPESPS